MSAACFIVIMLTISYSSKTKLARQIHEYTMLRLGIGTIFIDQLQTFHVFKKGHTMLVSQYAGLPSNLRSFMNKMAQFKAELKRDLNIHSFYSVGEFLTFNVCKMFFFLSYCMLYGPCII